MFFIHGLLIAALDFYPILLGTNLEFTAVRSLGNEKKVAECLQVYRSMKTDEMDLQA